MNELNVKTSKMPFILSVLLGLFFVPAALGLIISSVLNNFKVAPLGLGAMLLITFGFVIWLVLKGYSKSVKTFTSEGLTRNDGKQFMWTDLSRVVNQLRHNPAMNKKMLWRTEIHFKDGSTAWLIPSKVVNLQEVMNYVNNLPCEHSEVNV